MIGQTTPHFGQTMSLCNFPITSLTCDLGTTRYNIDATDHGFRFRKTENIKCSECWLVSFSFYFICLKTILDCTFENFFVEKHDKLENVSAWKLQLESL